MTPDFLRGFVLGKKEGREELQRELRALLGVDAAIAAGQETDDDR